MRVIYANIYKYRFYVLGACFILNLMLGWPGILGPDSKAQYAQAVSGYYTDHHPPLMSYVWHYLNMIYAGSGLIYLLQIAMLYTSAAIIMHCIDISVASNTISFPIVLFSLALNPQIFILSTNIFKDIQFTFSFLLAASILAFYTLKAKQPGLLAFLGICILLIYGAGVKFQGQYCLLVPAIWLGTVIYKDKSIWKKLLLGVVLYIAMFIMIQVINNSLVPVKNKNHSWQFVKLYDLAAISRDIQNDLIPAYNKLPAYTFTKLVERFKYPSVDPYIYSKDNIFTITTESTNMRDLQSCWWQSIKKYPLSYIKHRSLNMGYTLLSRPGYDNALNLLNKLDVNKMTNMLRFVIGAGYYIFMSHLLIVLLGIAYLGFGLINWHMQAAKVLVGLCLTAISMIAILFFMSMAGVPRYTYFAVVMINAAHPFALVCYLNRKKSVNITSQISTMLPVN